MFRKIISAIVLVGGIVALDIATKAWAFESLTHGFPVDGPAGVPLTLAFNQGIAFGLPIPSAGRWIIIFATILVLFVLSTMFLTAKPRDWSRLLAVQLVGAGAIGNLIDRVRWDRGVIDFIGPIQIGSVQWPIFNVADMAITTGAILLAFSLLREDTAATPVAATETLEMDGMAG
ncbi:MAG TPA: signal peptidase II [Longimicrobiales bacterium]